MVGTEIRSLVRVGWVLVLVTLAVFTYTLKRARHGRPSSVPEPTTVTVDQAGLLGTTDRNPMGVPSSFTLVEFGDYQCPACVGTERAVQTALATYTGKLNRIFRHWPLPQHQLARHAAIMAEVARSCGKFEQVHNSLMQLRTNVKTASVDQCLSSAGIKPGSFDRHVLKVAEQRVAVDMKAGDTLSLKYVPTFFLVRNGKPVVQLGRLSQIDRFITDK
jgi:protein-disulfide isomerase